MQQKFLLQTDRQMDRRTDGRKDTQDKTVYPLLLRSGGIKLLRIGQVKTSE